MNYKGRWHIVQYTKEGAFVAIVAGCGRNKRTWDSDHSYGRACAHARVLRKRFPNCIFKVERVSW